VDSLFYLHVALIAVFLLITGIYLISGQISKAPIALILVLSYSISLYFGYKGYYETSSVLLSGFTFLFLAYVAVISSSDHPYLIFKVSVYLIAPTMMASLLCSSSRPVYFYTFSVLVIVFYIFFGRIVPANPQKSMIELIGEHLLFNVFLLGFIAHFAFSKHRINQKVIGEADDLYQEAQEKSGKISSLLSEVQKIFGITLGLINEVTTIQEKIQNSNQKLESFKDDMYTFTASFKDSSIKLKDIGNQIQGLDEIVYNQSSAQEESAAATNQMVSSINNVAQIVDRKEKSAQGLLQTTEAGGQQLEGTVSKIKAISQRVDSILEMVEIINNIASQTNLLSMNAAIEAAHAGDAGKGFAVVAEEIRKLAEESAQNAASIAQVLSEVVENIHQGYDAGSATMEGFNHITIDVKETTNAFHEIAATTNELNIGSQEILVSLSELTELTKRVRSGTDSIGVSQVAIEDQLSATGLRISAIVSDIDSISESNKDIALSIGKILDIAEKLKYLNQELRQAEVQ